MDSPNQLEVFDETPKKNKKTSISKKRRKKGTYWSIEQEKAVVDYLSSTDSIEREKIYNKYLRHEIDQMVEIITRKYKLQREDMNERDVMDEVKSHLITKMDKFNPSENKKAFSYYSAIIKNQLLSEKKKVSKNTGKIVSYEDFNSDDFDNLNNSYTLDYDVDNNKPEVNIIQILCQNIEEEVEIIKDRLDLLKSLSNLNKDQINEIRNLEIENKVGTSLKALFNNYELFLQDDSLINTEKFTRQKFILQIKEMTLLSKNEVMIGMKRFNKIYKNLI